MRATIRYRTRVLGGKGASLLDGYFDEELERTHCERSSTKDLGDTGNVSASKDNQQRDGHAF